MCCTSHNNKNEMYMFINEMNVKNKNYFVFDNVFEYKKMLFEKFFEYAKNDNEYLQNDYANDICMINALCNELTKFCKKYDNYIIKIIDNDDIQSINEFILIDMCNNHMFDFMLSIENKHNIYIEQK